MNYTKISTIGQLKEAGWKSKSIKEELRDNLIHNIKNDVDSFTGIHG
ncbi:MAG: magnesium chelatase subunit I, partial [Nonlabens sp.]